MIKISHFLTIIIETVLLIISCLFLKPGTGFSQSIAMNVLSLYGAIITLITWLLVVFTTGSFFSNLSFIFLSFVLFQFGIPILYGLDPSYNSEYMNLFSGSLINSAEEYTIFCIQLFAIGLTLALIFFSGKRKLIFAKTNWANNTELVEKAACIMFLFSALLYFPATLYGALVLHSRFSMSSIVGLAKQYYFPSAFLILCYTKNKKLIKIIYIMILLECLLSMLTGGRTEGLVPLMAFIVYWINYRNNKIKFSMLTKKILMVISLFIILVLLEYIAKVRVSSSSVSITDLFQGNNFIESFIGELGFNFTSLLFVMSGIGLVGYKWGGSYLGAFVGLIPNSIDFTGIVNYFFNNLSGSTWIQNTYGPKLGFGVGFSLIAESYFNFSYYGCVMILVIGITMGAIFAKSPSNCNNWEKYVEIALLIGCLTVPRRDFYQFLKQIEYSIFLMALYLYICSKILKTKKNK